MEIGFLTLITYWANLLLGLGRDRIDQYTKSSCRNRPRMDVVSEGLELAPFYSRGDATRQASVPMVFSALRGISLVLQLVFLSFCSSYGV